MRLQHTTHKGKLRSILRKGLLTSCSLGKLPAVWLHTDDKTSWAFLHAVKRHGGDIRDVVTIEVDVPEQWVRCSSSPGLYYVLQDVPPELLGNVRHFNLVAASPLEVAKA